jgi:maltooligosyltrehalose trehalohydrolase
MGELAEKVRLGRSEFLRQFPSLRDPEAVLPDPADPRTFEACRLRWPERDEPDHGRVLALHRDLLEVRRNDSVLSAPQQGGVTFDGTALTSTSWLLRYFGPGDNDRLLLCNLGTETHLGPVSEPLLAPPEGCRWHLRWSSEQVRYGGSGVVSPEDDQGGWNLPGQSAVFLDSEK